MRLTIAQKKFLSLSIALIVLVQAGRATLLFAAPPKKEAAPKREPAIPLTEVEPGEPDLETPFNVVTDDEWLWMDFGSMASLAMDPPTGTRCNVSASITAGPTWQGNTMQPHYGQFRFPVRLNCTQAQGSQLLQCEPIVARIITYYKASGSTTWVGLQNDPTNATNPLYCGGVEDISVWSHNTINIVNDNDNLSGTYRSAIFIYKKSDHDAGNWNSFLLHTYTDWPYSFP